MMAACLVWSSLHFLCNLLSLFGERPLFTVSQISSDQGPFLGEPSALRYGRLLCRLFCSFPPHSGHLAEDASPKRCRY
uniref:Putative secreted protein n=1 Tax=Anopheles marajoara TaxID=58244 RepID=A0A2M4CCJ8_9DIPT